MGVGNGGAVPAMIWRGTEILKIRVEGVPLGLLESREYEEVTFQAEPGDTIVLYSDGITDHVNAAGAGFGRGGRAQNVRAHCGGSAGRLILTSFYALDNFSQVAFRAPSIFLLMGVYISPSPS